MRTFPDESGLPRSEDGTKPILGASVGLNEILLTLKRRAGQDRRAHWGLVIVNTFTFFDSVYHKDSSQADLQEAFDVECQKFILYLEGYLSQTTSPDAPVTPVIFYIPDYSSIPATIARKPNGRYKDMWAKYLKVVSRLPKDSKLTSYSDYTARWGVRLRSKYSPEIALNDWIHDRYMDKDLSGYIIGQPVMIITHCPVDLHLTFRLPRLELLERYTGEIKTLKEFGTKISSDPNVPFCLATHRAFGDKIHIEPMAKRGDKTKLLEQAAKNRWQTRTADYIARDISRTLTVTTEFLTRYPL